MPKRSILAAAAAAAIAASTLAAPALAAPPSVSAAATAALPRIELTQMMGRWYEVARLPNSLQRGCQAGASDWTRAGDGFTVVQSCHKGTPEGPLAEWKARARVADPATNAKFKMTFFGGLVSQEYRVLEHRPDQGWLILSTGDGKYLWLMSQKPTLPAGVRAQALARIKALGFDVGRLEFPLPSRG
jgi:apolipoprotein D and lipocalin family protein